MDTIESVQTARPPKVETLSRQMRSFTLQKENSGLTASDTGKANYHVGERGDGLENTAPASSVERSRNSTAFCDQNKDYQQTSFTSSSGRSAIAAVAASMYSKNKKSSPTTQGVTSKPVDSTADHENVRSLGYSKTSAQEAPTSTPICRSIYSWKRPNISLADSDTTLKPLTVRIDSNVSSQRSSLPLSSSMSSLGSPSLMSQSPYHLDRTSSSPSSNSPNTSSRSSSSTFSSLYIHSDEASAGVQIEGCTCQRSPKLILCKSCGEMLEGRVRQMCPVHPKQIFLMDLQCCTECKSKNLKEICSAKPAVNN